MLRAYVQALPRFVVRARPHSCNKGVGANKCQREVDANKHQQQRACMLFLSCVYVSISFYVRCVCVNTPRLLGMYMPPQDNGAHMYMPPQLPQDNGACGFVLMP